MLSKNQRLSKLKIDHLLKKGLKLANQDFLAKFSLNKGTLNRYSVVVSKKVLKLATDRNRLRRRTFEALRLMSDSPPIHFDCVLTLRKNFNSLEFAEIQEKLQQLLSQIYLQLNKFK